MICKLSNGFSLMFDEKKVEKGKIRVRVNKIKDTDLGPEFSVEVTNISDTDIMPKDVKLLLDAKIESDTKMDKVYIETKDMLGFCGLQKLDENWFSHVFFAFTDNEGTSSILVGFDDPSDFYFSYDIKCEKEELRFDINCPFEFITLKANETYKLPNLIVWTGNSLSALLENYARKLGKKLNARVNFNEKTPSGWCSWYSAYGTDLEEDIVKAIDQYAKSPLNEKLDYFLIDGGWNELKGESKYNWGDWDALDKYPNGMKYISDYMKSKGFKSGLWIAPFAITNNSTVYRDHKDWCIAKGEDLLNNGGVCLGLDLTHPEVKVYIRDTITKIFDEWGYDYIKIDFLLYGGLVGDRYDNSKTAAMAFKEGLDIIRDVAKDRLVLNC